MTWSRLGLGVDRCRVVCFLVLLALPRAAGADDLPQPRLDGMEPAVQAQLRAARDRARAQDDAEALGALGRLYQFYDLDESAEAVLRLACERAPDVAAWPYHLGVLYQEQRRLDEAAVQFDRVLALRPEDLPTVLRRAEVARLAGDVATAKRGFEAVLEREVDPAYAAAAHLGLGRLAVEGAPREAIERFQRVLELQPDATAVHHELGLAWRALGEREQARRHLLAAREGGSRPLAFPDPRLDALDALATGTAHHVMAGNRALRTGDLNVAVDAYRQALEIDAQNLPARQALAAALAQRGDLLAAEAEYRRVLALVPEAGGVWYALGNVLGEQERALGDRQQLPAALAALRRAVELLPEHRDAYFNLALLQVRAGDGEAAASSLARVIELDPQDVEARRQLAGVLQQLGRPAQAASELEWLVAADPGDATSRDALTALYLARGGELGRASRFSASAAAYQRAVELQPASAAAHFGRFTALLLAETYSDALAAVEDSRVALGRSGVETLPFDHALARLLATCPEAALRDGSRALQLAQAVFDARPSVEHGETVAMALAEVGRFDEAILWQQRVLEQLAHLGRSHDPSARARLEQYRAGRPVRAPWK